jgi:ATP-dependent RNA helicase DeaD
VRALRDGSRRLLLSTPLGARGLDIPHCSHVYLLDLPATADEYVHAAGRCGRAGRPGRVTVLGSPKEEFVLRRIANACGIEFEDARRAAPAAGDGPAAVRAEIALAASVPAGAAPESGDAIA